MTRASFAPSLVDPLGQVDSRGAASIEAAIVEQSMSEASSAGRPRLQRWDCRCRDAFPGPPSARCSLLRSSCGDMDDHRLSLRHAWRRMGQDRWGAGNNRYYHPLLIIEVTQFANLFAGARDRQAIVEVGRSGGLARRSPAVSSCYWLARLVLPELGALAATFATAATPIVKCMRAS